MENKLLELFFKSVADSLFLILVEPDDVYRFEIVNESFLKLTGLSEDQIIGKRVEEVFPPKSLALLLNKYREVLSKNGTVKWENVYPFPNGTRFGEVTVTPIKAEPSGQTFLVGAIHDITALREEKTALSRSEEFLRTLLENYPNGWICVFDKDLRYLFTAGKGLSLVNHVPEQMIGCCLEELYPSESAEFANQHLKKALAGETVSFEVPINELIFQINASPLRDESGEITSVMALAANITEQKRLNAKLIKSQSQLEAIFNNARDMIYLTNDEGRFVEVNPRTCELLGYSREELLQSTIWDVTPPQNRDDGKKLRRKFLSEGNLSGEYLMLKKDGTPVHLEFNSISSVLPGLNLSINRDITERKLSEQALRESEYRYRSIISSAPLSFFVIDTKGIFTLSEGKGLETTGLKPGELVGQSAFDIFKLINIQEYSGTVSNGVEVLLRVFAGETISGIIQSSRAYYESSFIPMLDSGGSIISIMGVSFDITKIKKAEEDLRISEERFRSMIEHSSDIVSLHNAKGKMTYQSPSIKRILGYDQKELEGLNVLDFIHPEDKMQVESEIVKVKNKNGVHLPFHTRFRHKNGTWRWFECYGNNQLDNPSVESIIFSARDVTARMEAEEQLIESKTSFRNVVESIDQGLLITDFEDKVIYINPRLTQLTGYTLDEIEGKPAYKFLLSSPEWDEMLQKNVERSRGIGELYEHQIIRKDGSSFWAQTNASSFRNGKGEIIGTIGILTDISERKRAEEILNETQAQLLLSQKMESIGLLAGGIAHDFNNMLTAINGYSDLILRQLKTGDPLRQKVEEIRKAGDRAAALTYQMLAFSRKQVLQPKVLNINDTVSDVIKMLDRLIGENIDLVTFLSKNADMVRIDPGQLAQVIMNLALNARDAMPPHGGKLTIETANVYLDENYSLHHGYLTAPGHYVMLAVSDNGTGIDAETQPRIFEPFFTTKAVGKGTGMGLATVYGIVKQSGGNIRLYSEVGSGTTFKIYLPRVEQQADAKPDLFIDNELPSGTETILLVEDEEIVRKMTKQILEMCNYTVFEATNGIHALEICEKEGCNVDLLITDVVMPNMGGLELAQNLTESQPKLRVLYISGYTDKAIVQHGVLDENTMFLQKPFTPETLAGKVRECLDA